MSESVLSLSVSIQEIPARHVACIEYRPGENPESMHAEIGNCFQRVIAWATSQGIDPLSGLTIGAITTQMGQMISYGCCLQVPGTVRAASPGIEINELPGGRYAVLMMVKDPAVIPASIGRFYQEYVPQNGLQIDGQRPTYEIYFEKTMEYCMPVI